MLSILKHQFVKIIETAGLASKKTKIQQIADKLTEESKGLRDGIMLNDIEDLALGIRSDGCKVFMFGQAHRNLFAFHVNPKNEKGDSDSEDSEESQAEKKKMFEEEIVIVTRPTALKFPRHTKPITNVSCGSAHMLALTEDRIIFSWGSGSYGALGFGLREDIAQPKRLLIHMNDEV